MPLRAVLAVFLMGPASPSTEPGSPATAPAEPANAEPAEAPAKPKPADNAPVVDEPQRPDAKTSATAFDTRAQGRTDPYGRRPAGVPTLSLQEIIRYSLDNPLVLKADAEVDAMRAQVRKADFAWVPIIETRTTLMPGVRVRCQDVTLDDGSSQGFDFQYCFSGEDPGDRDFNINRVSDWFAQLSEAGVRFEFRAETMVPLYTFGKIRNAKKAARAGLALKQLQRLQAEKETTLLVQQAHNTLLLARRTISILHEAQDIVDRATNRVEKDVGSGDDWDAEPTGDSERDPDDLFKVKLASTEVEQLMRKAMKIESVSLSALWALAGRAAPQGFDIAETDLTPYTIKGGLQGLDDYKEIAIRNRPEARMASAAVKAREYQEKLARSNFLPDLGVILQFSAAISTAAEREINQIYYTNGFNYTRLIAALGMRWRWDFHLKAFDLRAARANVRAAEYQRDAARLMLGHDVERAYADLVEAKYIVKSAREAVDWTWKIVISGEQRDTIGGGNTTELLRALERWYRKRFELEEAIQAHNDALARLSRAVGTALGVPDSKPRNAAAAP